MLYRYYNKLTAIWIKTIFQDVLSPVLEILKIMSANGLYLVFNSKYVDYQLITNILLFFETRQFECLIAHGSYSQDKKFILKSYAEL